ncbi:hypothetical protein L21SP2_0325 [Salinispira pacifica]|uniref:Uncharacterized protein n=1 Tax=Salinispira pacifica TaxID=1307761 RepID=V5WD60_9SPIO|nr:hypothetical protein L21SP2_0325 [Salinispira pacifica]
MSTDFMYAPSFPETMLFPDIQGEPVFFGTVLTMISAD